MLKLNDRLIILQKDWIHPLFLLKSLICVAEKEMIVWYNVIEKNIEFYEKGESTWLKEMFIYLKGIIERVGSNKTGYWKIKE